MKVIKVPTKLSSPHHLVYKARQILQARTSDSDGFVSPPYDAQCLDIRVTKALVGRALRVADTIIKELARQEIPVTTFKYRRDESRTTFEVQGIKFGLKVDEKSNRVPWKVYSKSVSPSNIRSFFHSNTVLVPSGLLRVTLSLGASYQPKKEWIDRPKKGKVEEQVTDIIASIPKMIEQEKQRQADIEEWNRQWEVEQEKRRQHLERINKTKQRLEQRNQQIHKRIALLREHTREWKKCNELRAFIAEVEKKADQQGMTIAPESDLGQWIRWARKYVKAIDPLQKIEDYHL